MSSYEEFVAQVEDLHRESLDQVHDYLCGRVPEAIYSKLMQEAYIALDDLRDQALAKLAAVWGKHAPSRTVH
jgi:hypothetical protein